MKLIVAGSREFTDYFLVKQYLDKIAQDNVIECIISGMARGADMLGWKWAKENNVRVIECYAEWNTYGKRAGYMRNERMAALGTHLLAFHNLTSRGTKHMIDIARGKGLKVKIVEVNC